MQLLGAHVCTWLGISACSGIWVSRGIAVTKYRNIGRQGRPGASSGQHGKYIKRRPLKQHSSYQPKIFTCLYYCQPADPVSGARSGIGGNALDAVKIEKPEKAKGEVTSCGMIIEIWPHPVTWAFQKSLHGEIIFIISEWWSCERLLVVHCVFSGWLIPCPRVVGLDSTQELFHSTLGFRFFLTRNNMNLLTQP